MKRNFYWKIVIKVGTYDYNALLPYNNGSEVLIMRTKPIIAPGDVIRVKREDRSTLIPLQRSNHATNHTLNNEQKDVSAKLTKQRN
jgi:hypothetical protein